MRTLQIIIDILKESVWLFNEMSPYLIFGFLFAGMLHIFISPVITHTPMGRFGAPDDLLGAVLWLLSPASSFVTGHRRAD
jgi:NAD(P)-dependent dehydrogenase (short-subunit alcohol dehydrogenase family)